MKTAALATLLLLAGAAAGCSSPIGLLPGTTDPELLQGGEWTLVAWAPDGRSLREVEVPFTTTFADPTVGGKAGPNSWGGRYAASSSGRLTFLEVSTTLIGGPEAEEAGEILEVFTEALTYEVTETRLRVRSSGGAVLDFGR